MLGELWVLWCCMGGGGGDGVGVAEIRRHLVVGEDNRGVGV